MEAEFCYCQHSGMFKKRDARLRDSRRAVPATSVVSKCSLCPLKGRLGVGLVVQCYFFK